MAGTRHRTDHQSRLDWWRRQIRRQPKTNLTIADFCRQLGVSVPTFDYGKRRVQEGPGTPRADSRGPPIARLNHADRRPARLLRAGIDR
jgi:hypothetical protein